MLRYSAWKILICKKINLEESEIVTSLKKKAHVSANIHICVSNISRMVDVGHLGQHNYHIIQGNKNKLNPGYFYLFLSNW
jgi:hypothetical protein